MVQRGNDAGQDARSAAAPDGYERRLELDDLLKQLVDRAHEVMRTQERLHGLLLATREIAADLSLPVLLRTIVTVARDLVGAEYAALGVVGKNGRLVEFVQVGMPAEEVRRIGHLPTGEGVLGLLVTDPRPIRMSELSRHSKSVGFPPGHPPMQSFLGVPITIGGRAFGNLYLTEKRGAEEFSAEDEELTIALAAAAAAAIDNSRLFEAVQRRERWLDASRKVTNALLGVVDRQAALDRQSALDQVAAGARAAAGADAAAVLLPSGPDRLAVQALDRAPGCQTMLPESIDIDASVCGDAFRFAKAMMFEDLAGDHPGDGLLGPGSAALGPVMVAPLAAVGSVQGVLMVANRTGGPVFPDDDLEMATALASQAALVNGVVASQAAARRADMLEERGRIARDLHDQVIQRLFVTGLGLQALASDDESGPMQHQILRHIDELDATIREIRSTIFVLRHEADEPGMSLRARALDLIREETGPSGLSPRVSFDGPIDSSVTPALAEDVLAVLREALSNALRHARATRIDVQMTARDGVLTLLVRDDGVGIPLDVQYSGLRHMAERAEHHGGRHVVESRPGEGVTITWSAPLD